MDSILMQKPEKIPAIVMYNIMTGGNSKQMKSLTGRGVVTANSIVVASTAGVDGEPRPYVVIEVDGAIHRTSSPSFIRGVQAYFECFDPDVPFRFTVEVGRSASGREFITFNPVFEEGSVG